MFVGLFLPESHQPVVQDAVNVGADPSSSYLSCSDFCAVYCKSFRFGSAADLLLEEEEEEEVAVRCGGQECC